MLARIAELQGAIRAVCEGQERVLARVSRMNADPEPVSAHTRWFQPMKAALLALPDDVAQASAEAQRRMPEIALDYSTDVLAALQGTTTCMPMGLTRSMEDEFRHNR